MIFKKHIKEVVQSELEERLKILTDEKYWTPSKWDMERMIADAFKSSIRDVVQEQFQKNIAKFITPELEKLLKDMDVESALKKALEEHIKETYKMNLSNGTHRIT